MAGNPVTHRHPARRSDLDWLRVLAVLLLVPFHSALVFNLDPQSVVYAKDRVQSDFLVQMAGFIHRFHMPLLFAIAGAATWFALGRHSAACTAASASGAWWCRRCLAC